MQNDTSSPNSSSSPVVSVIVAAYGQEEYLSSALESLVSQTFTDWEAIVTDDDSPDNVREIAEDWARRDNRIKFVHSENLGLAGVRNMAVDQAEGKYILMLDGDDWISRRYLEKCVGVLEGDPNVKVVLSDLEIFGTENYISKVQYPGYASLLINNPLHVSALIRKEDFQIIGGFDPFFKKGLEDWEFWIRFLYGKDPAAVRILEEVMFHYRKKESSMLSEVKRNKDRGDIYRQKIFSKHKEKYQRYFGNDIEEWMLMDRNYCSEIKYLEENLQVDIKDPKEWGNGLLRGLVGIVKDPSLNLDHKKILLEKIYRKRKEDYKKIKWHLSIGKRLKWRMLSKSPERFISYIEWRKK